MGKKKSLANSWIFYWQFTAKCKWKLIKHLLFPGEKDTFFLSKTALMKNFRSDVKYFSLELSSQELGVRTLFPPRPRAKSSCWYQGCHDNRTTCEISWTPSFIYFTHKRSKCLLFYNDHAAILTDNLVQIRSKYMV